MTSTQMRAAVLTAHGSPLQIGSVPRPEAGEGLVLIRVKASAVNPLDLKISKGQAAHARHPLPAILGIDVAGTVESVGRGVTASSPVMRSMEWRVASAACRGRLPNSCAADATLLAPKPKNLGMREAAALPLIFITAWEGLVDRAHVHGGQRCSFTAARAGLATSLFSLRERSMPTSLPPAHPRTRRISQRLGATLHRLQANRGRGLCRGTYRRPRL